MAISTNRAMHVTAPVTVGTAAQLVTATDPLGPNDAGRLFYDTTEAIAGGIGWQVWNGDALVTDYTYVTQATLLSGEDQANDVIKVEHQYNYETVAVSQTAWELGDAAGTGGAAGDFLHRLMITVAAADATSLVTINDGGGAEITVIAASTPVGAYNVEINALSTTGSWQVTTLAGATVMAIGRFTA